MYKISTYDYFCKTVVNFYATLFAKVEVKVESRRSIKSAIWFIYFLKLLRVSFSKTLSLRFAIIMSISPSSPWLIIAAGKLCYCRPWIKSSLSLFLIFFIERAVVGVLSGAWEIIGLVIGTPTALEVLIREFDVTGLAVVVRVYWPLAGCLGIRLVLSNLFCSSSESISSIFFHNKDNMMSVILILTRPD